MSAPPPPPPAPVTPPFCSVVPGRRPEMKVHNGLGHAKNAVARTTWAGGHRNDDGEPYHYCNGVHGGQIYKWSGTEWELLFDVPPTSPECELPWRQKDKAASAAFMTFTDVVQTVAGVYVVVGRTSHEARNVLLGLPGVADLACTHLNGLATRNRSRMVAYAIGVDEVNDGALDAVWRNRPLVVAVTDDDVAQDVRARLDLAASRLPDTTWHVLAPEPTAEG